MATIYVRLLDEGTEVFRPVDADELSSNTFKIRDNEGLDQEETWEFPRGSIVSVEKVRREGEEILLATKLR